MPPRFGVRFPPGLHLVKKPSLEDAGGCRARLALAQATHAHLAERYSMLALGDQTYTPSPLIAHRAREALANVLLYRSMGVHERP